MKILAFAASNNKNSINKKLITYLSGELKNPFEILDLNDFEMPLYGIDLENEIGIPDLAKSFFQKIGESDALVISLAEHNGSYTVAFKNIFDWCSRIQQKVFQNKPAILLSTSIGKRGGANVLREATNGFPHFGANILGSLAVPSFNDNFDNETGKIIDQTINENLLSTMGKLFSEE